MTEIVGAELSFEKGSAFLWELAGLKIGFKQVKRVDEALGAEIAEDERICTETDPVASLPLTMYLGLDGTGIPMRPEELVDWPGKQSDGSSRNREVKLCVVWSAETTDDRGFSIRDEGSATYSDAIESVAEATERSPGSRKGTRNLKMEGSTRSFPPSGSTLPGSGKRENASVIWKRTGPECATPSSGPWVSVSRQEWSKPDARL